MREVKCRYVYEVVLECPGSIAIPSQSIDRVPESTNSASRRRILQSVKTTRLSAFQIDRFDSTRWLDQTINRSRWVTTKQRHAERESERTSPPSLRRSETSAREGETTDRNGRVMTDLRCYLLTPPAPKSIAVGGYQEGQGHAPTSPFRHPKGKKVKGFGAAAKLWSADRQASTRRRQFLALSRSTGFLGCTCTQHVTTRRCVRMSE